MYYLKKRSNHLRYCDWVDLYRHRDNVFARCVFIFPLLRCQAVWTKRVHNFLFLKSSFRIRRTTVLGMFKGSAVILDAIRLSFMTKSATAAMFTSVTVDFGRSHQSSSSTGSLPFRNREYHLQTFDRFRASLPQAVNTNTSVSVADRPALN